jgi:uncharacterized protein (TIRG00374 family)
MKRWITLITPLIGLAIFVWIIRGIGFGNVVEIIRAIDPRRLLIFPVFTALILWVHALRWQYLMRIIGIEYGLWRSAMVWAIGFFGASITPAKVGDALRAYYLSRDIERPFAICFLTVVIDRLFDVIVMLVLGVVAVFIFSYLYIQLPSVWIILGCVPLLVGVIYLLLHRELMRKLFGPFFRALTPEKYRDELSLHFHSFYDTLGIYLRNWRRTSLCFIHTLVFWILVLLLAYSVTRILELQVPMGYVALILPMLTLVEIIPISISGLGTRDAAAIYFFGVIGIDDPAQAVAFSLLYVLLGLYAVALVGFFAWFFMPRSLREKVRAPLPSKPRTAGTDDTP